MSQKNNSNLHFLTFFIKLSTNEIIEFLNMVAVVCGRLVTLVIS